MENGNRIAIFDLDSIAFAAGWGKKIPNGEGDYKRDEKGRLLYEEKTEEELFDSVNTIMVDLLSQTDANAYIAYIKGKKTGSHRYAVKDDYKCNRPKESPKWWPFVKQCFINNWGAVEVNDIEVDDAVNITKLAIPNSFIVAVDKDLLHLEGRHYNWRINEWIEVDKCQAEEYFWKDMITGQPGDGVAGLPKYGPKAAEKVLSLEGDGFANNVFREYIKVFGQDLGIKEFYKNYTCLKILEEYEGFIVPEPIIYKEVETITEDSFFE